MLYLQVAENKARHHDKNDKDLATQETETDKIAGDDDKDVDNTDEIQQTDIKIMETIGATGATGPSGQTGPKGDKGDRGDQGYPGPSRLCRSNSPEPA